MKSNLDVPVKTTIIPAKAGLRAINKDQKNYYIGEEIIAWAVGVQQHKMGDIWPDKLFVTAITYSCSVEIEAVIYPDGHVETGCGEFYESYDKFIASQKDMDLKMDEIFNRTFPLLNPDESKNSTQGV